MTSALLDIEHLRIDLPGRGRADGRRRVIHDVSLSVPPGASVGLVGESGSGKSMTTKSVMGLLPKGAVVSGAVRFRGDDLSAFDRPRWAAYRGQDVSMIHQDPRSYTNPLVKMGDFLVEAVVAGKLMSRAEARDRACVLLRDVGIADAPRRMEQYPHELSGGLLQRMMIVMALMPSPSLVLADEPTTALDPTVQAEVVAILSEQIRERSLGLLFITHDLDLAAAINDSLAVMYAGVIVEQGPSSSLVSRPRHPYTAGLLRSRPRLDAVDELRPIPGRPLSAFEAGEGCVFASRCEFATDRCRLERPALSGSGDRSVACHRADELSDVLVGESV
ncbi:ABC transporter ATP-binding protein [Streptomyces sp. NPDC048277]|uniref:ABC transporter ATP-binding protein n=1 Tax=Streptomyces sp. NPDC048277 TaxID=3155027 RepID=UPI00340AA009